MFDDWIDILLRGTHEISLPAMAVTSEQIGELRGSGRISWNAEDIRLQGVTGSAESLTSNFFNGSFAPGLLVPRATFLTFTGQTQSGWEVTTDPIPRDGYRIHSDVPDVVWDLAVTGVTLRRDSTDSRGRMLRFLMGPVPNIWPRGTETEIRNESFGSRSSSLDWLSTNTNAGRVMARQRSSEWFEVRVLPEDGKPMCDPCEVGTAIARAFGFLFGRRCVIRGHEEINQGALTHRLDTRFRRTTKNNLLEPLGRQLTFMRNVERFLAHAIDFFLSDLGRRVAEYLFLCWDTADNAFQTRLAITSTCVEGLLRVAAESLGPVQADAPRADVEEFNRWIASRPTGYSARFLDRLRGVVGDFTRLRPGDILHDWIARGVLGVTQEDRQAWQAIRNPSAHGHVAAAESPGQLQIQVTRHDRVQNLLNKIVLRLIGYSGEYIDYSQRGYPPAVFPNDVVSEGGATTSQPEESPR